MPDSPENNLGYGVIGAVLTAITGILGKVIYDASQSSDRREDRMAKERADAEKASHETALKMVQAMTDGTIAINSLKETICRMNDALESLPCREYLATVREIGKHT